MANDLNQCNFIGRLGADPETRYSADGLAITNFRIAVGWKSKDKEGTEWVSIVAFGKLGEICGEYLHKGSRIFVSGRFKTDTYEKDGEKRYSTKIVADQMQMLDAKRDDDNERPTSQRAPQSRQPAPSSGGGMAELDDSIPF